MELDFVTSPAKLMGVQRKNIEERIRFLTKDAVPALETELNRLRGEWWKLRPRIEEARQKWAAYTENVQASTINESTDNSGSAIDSSLLFRPIHHTATVYAQLLAEPALQASSEHSLHKLLVEGLYIAEQVEHLMEIKKRRLAAKYVLQGEIARRARTQADED